jgi:hypothetical protein
LEVEVGEDKRKQFRWEDVKCAAAVFSKCWQLWII